MENAVNFEDLIQKSSAQDSADLSNAGLFSGLENLFTGNLDYQRELGLQNRTMAFNAAEAQKQRDYEERLANTAYQRAAADMKSIGLNPYLAYSSGSAFTPSGSAASVGASHSKGAGSGFAALLGLVGQMVRGSFLLSASAQRAPQITKNFYYKR